MMLLVAALGIAKFIALKVFYVEYVVFDHPPKNNLGFWIMSGLISFSNMLIILGKLLQYH